MQDILLLNQFLTNLSDRRFSAAQQITNEGAALNQPNQQLSAGVTVELNYNKAEFSLSGSSLTYSESSLAYSASANQVNGRQLSVQMMELRLGAEVQNFAGTEQAPELYRSQAYSPQNVANKVLQFVEQRIAKEAQAGADNEELTRLFSEGLAGVNKGYGEAIEEIQSRGLLTGELEQEIDEGYDLIERGFDRLQDKYPGAGPGLASAPAPNGEVAVRDSAKAAETEVIAPLNKDSVSVSPQLLQTRERAPAQPVAVADKHERPRIFDALAGSTTTQFAGAGLGINITTQDGDQISIHAGQFFSQRAALETATGGGNQRLSSAQTSVQMGGYELVIDGDLDEGELQALESLLLQVEDIAGAFFSGDLDQAFATALEMNADMSEIASYAVAMNSLRTQQVETAYQQKSAQMDTFKPLTDLLPGYTNAIANAAEFSQPAQLVTDLISKILGPVDSQQYRARELFASFSSNVLDRLAS